MASAPDPEVEQSALDLVRRIRREGVIDLRAAAELLGPSKRGGAPRTVDSVRRYIVAGTAGVRLEGFCSPAGWVTSAAAVERFLARLHLARLGQARIGEEGQGQEERRARVDLVEAAEQARAELQRMRTKRNTKGE